MNSKNCRLLFLENRSITEIWSRAAQLLMPRVQCELLRFSPAYGLDFPGPSTLLDLKLADPKQPESDVSELIDLLMETDRSAYLYGATRPQIQRAVMSALKTVDAMEFDVVFGEVTSIYERTVNFYCRKNGIPFLAPMTARIPADRFFFIDGDLLFPLPVVAETDRKRVVNAIDHAITNAGKNDLASTPEVIATLLSLLQTYRGWAGGERLHTPSPWRRAELTCCRLAARLALSQTKFTSLTEVNESSFVFCMHVQPESTLDTYSPQYIDQARLIRTLHEKCLARGRRFFLRLHPRGRDEMHRFLNDSSNADIPILSPSITMADLLATRPTVISVTGTVLMEAAIAGAPAITLGNSYIGTFPGIRTASLDEFEDILTGEQAFERSRPEDQTAWFENINRYSHAGVIAPPEWGLPLAPENIANIAVAFDCAIDWIQKRPKAGPSAG